MECGLFCFMDEQKIRLRLRAVVLLRVFNAGIALDFRTLAARALAALFPTDVVAVIVLMLIVAAVVRTVAFAVFAHAGISPARTPPFVIATPSNLEYYANTGEKQRRTALVNAVVDPLGYDIYG